MKRRGKIITGIVIAGAAAAAVLFFLSQKSRGGPVDVYPVANLSSGGGYDMSAMSGNITSGKVQQITKDETAVEKIYVEEGDTVEEGDLLLKYDTEEFKLKLKADKARIAVLKANLAQYQNDLIEYQKTSPASYVPAKTKTVDHGALNIRSVVDKGDASDSDPNYDMLYRVKTSTRVTAAFLKALRSSGKTAEFLIYNGNVLYGSWIVKGSELPTTNEVYKEITIEEYLGTEEVPVDDGDDDDESGVDQRIPKEEENPDDPSGEGSSEEETEEEETQTETRVNTRTRTVYEKTEEEAITSDWVIGNGLEYTGGNLVYDGSGAGYGTFQSMEPKTYERYEKVVISEGGYEEGYSREELNALIAETRENIKSTDMELREAQLNYEQDKLSGDSGKVRARFDGKVVTVGNLEEAAEGDVLLTVTGEETYQVTIYVNEYSLDTMTPGTLLNITAYESGVMCQARISSVSDSPAEGFSSYGGNPNSSWYQATADITEPNGELIVGEYCEAVLSEDAEDDGIYLELAYVRSDDGGSYVMAVGEEGLLEKRYVKTGQIMWGYVIEILEGLTQEDRIAVPYGKNIREGAPVNDKDYPEYW